MLEVVVVPPLAAPSNALAHAPLPLDSLQRMAEMAPTS